MRLHQLDIAAFGPFAGSVQVDFDELSQAGLFLLSGATGAGKTSVLDAVCFALYGDVPGDRSSAKRLRSDQAEPGVVPRVTLEATLAGRRFRIVRSPAWERPKKRGSGTTTESAHVTLTERVGDQWLPLSSRLDEVGDLVTRLLGMNLTQFTQVAMLPQGRFQAFLRARSDERHRLLQQLFRTGRFERVEHWLRDRRLELGRADAVLHERAADLVSRISEAADIQLPDAWDVHDLAPADGDGSIGSWADDLGRSAAQAAVDAARRAATAAGRETTVRERLERTRAAVERHRRLSAARAERDRLDALAEQHAADLARLETARRAATVAPVRRVAAEAAAVAETSRLAAAEAVAQARDRVGGSDLAEAAAAAVESAAAARAARPRVVRLEQLQAVIADVGSRLQQHRHDTDHLHEQRSGLPRRIDETRAEVATARAASARVESLTAVLAEAAGRVEAHARLAALAPEIDAARGGWLDARETALELQETLVVLQQARLEGMAAEIAGQLAVGADCPVCGSHEHPHKAGAVPGAPDAAAERAARSAVDDARVFEHAHDQKLRDLETARVVATERTGGTTAVLAERHRDEVETELVRARAEAARLDQSERALARDVAHLADLERRLTELTAAAVRCEAELVAASAEHELVRDELAGVIDASHATLEAQIVHHAETERMCREALRLIDAAESAQAAAEQAARALDRAAADAGFPSAGAALEAALTRAEVDALAARTSEHDRRLSAVHEVLADAVRHGHPPDATPEPGAVGVAESEHSAALDELGAAQAEERLGAARVERLVGLTTSLEATLVDWRPLRAELEVTTALSSFVEGKSTDNALRMRLSAYVLAYRLSQVVDAANERLARMSDRRYSLEHTGRRGAGETRGGLSLLVRDDWSGESRDPATLSGGETFVVSLALALGLADVIAHEAGGASLDTLFVDEGFGSLDADTLDDVMDTLDSLRDGGRVVGVVSHVAEMRDRIPTQLVVTKARTGSTVAIRR